VIQQIGNGLWETAGGGFGMTAANITKIANVQIHDIEAIGIGAKYQARDGWR
jgi:hypothetical protein